MVSTITLSLISFIKVRVNERLNSFLSGQKCSSAIGISFPSHQSVETVVNPMPRLHLPLRRRILTRSCSFGICSILRSPSKTRSPWLLTCGSRIGRVTSLYEACESYRIDCAAWIMVTAFLNRLSLLDKSLSTIPTFDFDLRDL